MRSDSSCANCDFCDEYIIYFMALLLSSFISWMWMFWYGIFEELFKAFGHGIVQLIISFCALSFILL
jgi:hypothetical protein